MLSLFEFLAPWQIACGCHAEGPNGIFLHFLVGFLKDLGFPGGCGSGFGQDLPKIMLVYELTKGLDDFCICLFFHVFSRIYISYLFRRLIMLTCFLLHGLCCIFL